MIPGSQTSGLRFPSLDGLRAISIALVLCGHLAGTHGFPFNSSRRTSLLAEFGVRVFFVISGFLITTLLIKEARTAGKISMAGFYARRALRIFPALYFYLLVVILLNAFSVISVPWREIAYAATYTINYVLDRGWYVGHLWSLSVEEQFYLFWPLTMALAGQRWAMYSAGLMVIVAPIIRLVFWFFVPSHREGITTEFQTVADAMAVGCLLAGNREWLWQKDWYRRFLTSNRFMAVPVCGLILLTLSNMRMILDIAFCQTLLNIAIALYIDRYVRLPDTRMGQFLNWPPVAFMGVLSYSLYLWQQLFLNRGSTSIVAMFPLNIMLAVSAAMLSHFWVEKPFLALRSKLPKAVGSERSFSSHR